MLTDMNRLGLVVMLAQKLFPLNAADGHFNVIAMAAFDGSDDFRFALVFDG